jgi:N-acetylglutamate synthase-like GNAT family acetyltransferase
MAILVRFPQTKEDFKTYYALRYQVLREPFGQVRGTEKDDFEPISQHLMAIDDQTGAVVGVVKWLEREPGVAWFSHLAIAFNWQKQGVGKLLVLKVEEAAREKGYKIIGANARLNSTDYFAKLGYQIRGLPSHYFGTIQTVWMEKEL